MAWLGFAQVSASGVVGSAVAAGGTSTSRGGVTPFLGLLRWVEDVVKRWGVCWGRGDPSFLGWVWAHASGMVFRAAHRAAEDFRGFAGSVGVRYERDPLDEALPLSEGAVVLCGGEDVDVPGWLFLAFARADIFLPDKVKAVDGY